MIALAVLCIANAFVLVMASSATGLSSPRVQLIAVMTHCALGAVLVFWVYWDQRFERTPYLLIFGLAIALRLIAAMANPLLEDDHYRYLWDGFRTATAFNPYALAPSEFFSNSALGDAWQEILSGINHPELPTIYGPVLQYLFALAYFINPGKLGAIQGLLLILDLLVIVLLMIERVPSPWVLIYAIHPAITKEVMASAHPDIVVGLFLVLACMAWRRSRPYLTGALLAAAIATKLPAILGGMLLVWAAARKEPAVPVHSPNSTIAPWLKRTSWRALFPDWPWVFASVSSMLAVLALLYLPFWWASGSEWASLMIFGERWKFNPLLFRLLELLLPTGWARPTALIAFLLSAVGLLLMWRKQKTGCPPIDLAVMALLFVAPVVNPWYWTWGLAMAALCNRPLVSLLACLGGFSYLNSTVLSEASLIQAPELGLSYSVPWLVTLLQIVLMFAVVMLYRRNSKRVVKET
jgi:alpha-1,6-mannosyltransferase